MRWNQQDKSSPASARPATGPARTRLRSSTRISPKGLVFFVIILFGASLFFTTLIGGLSMSVLACGCLSHSPKVLYAETHMPRETATDSNSSAFHCTKAVAT